MAIVNRTPDSFYDRGANFADDAAMAAAHRMIAEGADVVDVGGVKAVIWTDAVQFALFLVGGIFASVAVFTVFIIVLLVRPEGIAGASLPRRV